MSPELEDCETQALKLAPRERAALAAYLIASLDAPEDAKSEQLWLEEADRRYQEYKKGNISARTADEVLQDARAAIK